MTSSIGQLLGVYQPSALGGVRPQQPKGGDGAETTPASPAQPQAAAGSGEGVPSAAVQRGLDLLARRLSPAAQGRFRKEAAELAALLPEPQPAAADVYQGDVAGTARLRCDDVEPRTAAVGGTDDERLPDHLLPVESQAQQQPSPKLRKLRRKRASVPDGPLPTRAEIWEAGERFLREAFDDVAWESDGALFEALLDTPFDNAWDAKRREHLQPMSVGTMERIDKRIFNITTALQNRPDWFALWLDAARCCPREWLVLYCGVGLLTRSGDLRALDNRRARSMLVMGLAAWLCCTYDPDGDPEAPWVIRLPRGAWGQMLAYWRPYAGGAQRIVPSDNTLTGTYQVGGKYVAGQLGWLASWVQAGIAKTAQLEGFSAPDGLAGPWTRNEITGKSERWGFLEVRLKFAAPDEVAAMKMGPPIEPRPKVRRRPMSEPPSDALLDAIDEELARAGCASEAVTRPAELAPDHVHAARGISTSQACSSEEAKAQMRSGNGADEGAPRAPIQATAPSATTKPEPPPAYACPPPTVACESQRSVLEASHQSRESLSELLERDELLRDDPFLARFAARVATRPTASARPGFVEVYERCRAELDALESTQRKPPG